MVIEIRIGFGDWKEAWGIFQNDGSVFHLALGDSCTGSGCLHLPKIQRPVDLRCGYLALLRSAVSTEERKRGREERARQRSVFQEGLALC